MSEREVVVLETGGAAGPGGEDDSGRAADMVTAPDERPVGRRQAVDASRWRFESSRAHPSPTVELAIG